MKLYLIRHGQTDWNIQGKIQGSNDVALNQTGRSQARMLAKGMDSRPVARIYSSPQKRAVETARIIADRQHVDVYLVPGLVEVEFGLWEGMTWDEIKEKYPDEYEKWTLNPLEAGPPGGETRMQALKRSAQAIEDIIALSGSNHDIAVVSHGATLAYVVAYLLRDHPGGFEIIVENASITTIGYNSVTQDCQLLKVNETDHLGVSID